MVALTIPLAPVPASRVRKGRYGSWFHSEPYASYLRDATAIVGRQLRAAHHVKEWDGAWMLTVEFVLPLPEGIAKYPTRKAARERWGRPCWVKPDLDNFLKGILEVLEYAGAFDNDSRVAGITAVKRYQNQDEAPHTSIVLARYETVLPGQV